MRSRRKNRSRRRRRLRIAPLEFFQHLKSFDDPAEHGVLVEHGGEFVRGCVEPGGDVAAGDDEGVAVGDGKPVPETQDEVVLVEDSVSGRIVEGAVHAFPGLRLPPSSTP